MGVIEDIHSSILNTLKFLRQQLEQDLQDKKD